MDEKEKSRPTGGPGFATFESHTLATLGLASQAITYRRFATGLLYQYMSLTRFRRELIADVLALLRSDAPTPLDERLLQPLLDWFRESKEPLVDGIAKAIAEFSE